MCRGARVQNGSCPISGGFNPPHSTCHASACAIRAYMSGCSIIRVAASKPAIRCACGWTASACAFNRPMPIVPTIPSASRRNFSVSLAWPAGRGRTAAVLPVERCSAPARSLRVPIRCFCQARAAWAAWIPTAIPSSSCRLPIRGSTCRAICASETPCAWHIAAVSACPALAERGAGT